MNKGSAIIGCGGDIAPLTFEKIVDNFLFLMVKIAPLVEFALPHFQNRACEREVDQFFRGRCCVDSTRWRPQDYRIGREDIYAEFIDVMKGRCWNQL